MSSLSAMIGQLGTGWRGVALIAITYVYFLIFAQFAFLNRLAEVGIADTHLQIVMAAMAIGGILFSLLPGLTSLGISPSVRLRLAFFACGSAAALTRLPLGLAASLGIAFMIGAGLGLLTVTLVSNLPLWIGSDDRALLRVGIGTGIGYWVCNLPPLFTASPAGQATTASSLCLVGLAIASAVPASTPIGSPRVVKPVSFLLVLLGFTALVWLDSAAFFIIQNTPSLKAGTWQGDLHLWTNGILHLAAAIASALLLRKRGLSFVLGLAVLALAFACLCLHASSQIAMASLFYPVGVSLYSVALVAYPSLLSCSLSVHQRAVRAGLIYAIAGWFGSAMGIGMGQNLRQVPLPFVLLAGLIVVGPGLIRFLQTRTREVGLVTVASIVALGLFWSTRKVTADAFSQPAQTAIERGRTVYISEGCINCHSQYVRPTTADILMWGPAQTIDELRREQPPLIGNRRQGPDLSQVGARRSPLWLKAHFIDPSAVSPHSFMPSYAYLFHGSDRGDDLLQYVSSLKSPRYLQHIELEQAWTLPAGALAEAKPEEGARLYSTYCSTCHESNGATRLAWSSNWKRLPPSLETGPWTRISPNGPPPQRVQAIARVIKFGIPETDMPGHEYLSDRHIASIASWLNSRMTAPRQPLNFPTQRKITMKTLVAATFAVFLIHAAAAQHQTFAVDPNASEVKMTLKTNHEIVDGTFHVQSGSIEFDPAAQKIMGTVVVGAGTGKTGNDSRDKKMNKDVLKVEQYATVTFAPKAFTGTLEPKGDSTIQVSGVFTLLGTPHDLTVPMQVHIDGSKATAKAQFTVPYLQWGLKNPSFLVWKAENDVAINLTLNGQVSN